MQAEDTRVHRVKAVAAMFDVSAATIYRAVKAGQLDALKLGSAVRIPEQAINTYRKACAKAAGASGHREVA
jgi:excisionase family DNA binding protein